MKVLKIILIVLAVLAALFVIVGLLLPSKFKSERSAVINAPQDELFAQINDVKNWNNWNAWNKMDTAWNVTYSDNTVGEGAWYSWVSEDENVGKGKVTITKSEPMSNVEGTMEFAGMKPAKIYHTLEPQDGDGVKVTFGIDSEIGSNIFMKVVFYFFGDGMVGGNYEKSLKSLEEHVKNNPKPTEPVNIEPEMPENDSVAKRDATEVEIID